jgi:UPF0755 protein
MVKWLSRFCGFIALLVVLAAGASYYLVDQYRAQGPLAAAKTIHFPRKQGFVAVVLHLHKEDVIRDPYTFGFMAVVLNKYRRFKAGEYEFSPGMSAQEVVDLLESGRVMQHKVTLPEGLTVREALALIEKHPVLEGEISGDIKEGSLLPETYLFMRGDKRQDIVKRMQADMKKTIDQLWPNRAANLPISTPEQAIVLASIVEKETGVAHERPLVASVFVNRLRKSMRLQSDPTTVYGIEQKLGKPMERALTYDDLESVTPYNTYVIDGLPPAPIANPGKASIAAVLNPPQSDYLYFVATGTGGHRFAKSLDEHNNNVRLYRAVMSGKSN